MTMTRIIMLVIKSHSRRPAALVTLGCYINLPMVLTVARTLDLTRMWPTDTLGGWFQALNDLGRSVYL